ncbi:hypothetical protein [Amphiplicatus metriothermophilus]|uniref:Lipoprotein n=1 Tax=Amphiplicatus metriothermophilus TaxID=1519374 RepID=A0A239PYW9_9PROT|nr:hypothetical protein [Amphiplicatus metriothermophilus]MBB5518244.1 hypothetical protein [Amphiplicatus metriothermophilus]SNT75454.1 hypothetical protein SAMN06297382_2748 [Amphiplicatus metriothermophilus]
MTVLRLSALVVLFAALGAGCASQEALRLSQEPTWQVGYGDGCVTATEEDKSFSTKRARDAYLFDNDRAYRAGWRQGYLQCGGRASNSDDGGRILGQQNEY